MDSSNLDSKLISSHADLTTNPNASMSKSAQLRRDKNEHKEMLNALLKNYRSDINDKPLEDSRDEWGDKKSKEEVTCGGLESIARNLNHLSNGRLSEQLDHVRAPHKKLMVMIIGNHSAGKSSFINWYCEDDIQKTRVAIETLEINLIMHGNRRADLKGVNLMKQFPFMKDLYDKKTRQERFPGLLSNLSVKTSPSSAKQFDDVVFIDTPGLADGGLKYRFNVEEAYLWLAKHCDLVFVFLDPVGQALCDKTNQVVKKIVDQNLSEVRFYMTKGDMFKSEDDRYKTMCQITQALSSRVIEPTHGFEMPVIYIPEEATPRKTVRGDILPMNQIGEVTALIEERLDSKVQKLLAKFKKDITVLRSSVKQLKDEQTDLSTKPVQQLLLVCSALLKLSVVLTIMATVDILTNDEAVNQTFSEYQHHKLYFIVRIIIAMNFVSTKLLIHDFNYQVLLFCLISIPLLTLALRQIPKRYIVFSEDVLVNLSFTDQSLQSLKQKYDQMSGQVNQRALFNDDYDNSVFDKTIY